MRRQETYIHSPHDCIHNRAINNVVLSSDICDFNEVAYDISAATKITTGITICDFSTISMVDSLTAKTDSCLISQGIPGSCVNKILWSTQIKENERITYDEVFYVSFSTGTTEIPTQELWLESISSAFTVSNYEYKTTGSSIYELSKPYGVKEFEVSLCLDIDILPTCTGTCSATCYTACSDTFNTISSGDTGVYILPSSAKTIDFNIHFTGDTTAFTAQNSEFKYEIYKSDITRAFRLPEVYSSELFNYPSFSSVTGDVITQTLNLDELNIDGDYLIKGYFEADVCTTFLNKIGTKIDTKDYRNGPQYGLYDNTRDFYFIAIREAETPVFRQGTSAQTVDTLFGTTILPTTSGQTIFVLNTPPKDKVIVNLNGLTLVDNVEYTVSDNIITMTNPTKLTDVITVVYIVGETVGFKHDFITVPDPIVSGVTGNEGNNQVYYNTTQNKYEVYTTQNPVSSAIISLNGVTLASGIDYYQSTTNSRRWILNGTLVPNDIINIYYNGYSLSTGDIFISSPTIAWSITTPAPATGITTGIFTVQVAESGDTTFSNIKFSSTTDYEPGVVSYSTKVTLTGSANNHFIYRVCNEKNYKSIVGDPITSISYSETLPIRIATNSLNSY